ncbi:MAG: hypothetical protein V3R82_04940 [Candidatus Hydrothermarchaeales archaeon]
MTEEGNKSGLDGRIKEFNILLKEKEEQAQVMMGKIVNILADFSKRWYENTAESIVKGNYEITIGLKKDQLKKLKSEVKELTINASDEIKGELIKEDYWPKYYSIKEGRKLEDGLRIIFGKLGEALGEYGYIKDPQVWHGPSKSAIDVSKPCFFYPYGLELPEEYLSLYEEYEKVINEVRGLRRNIAQMERERKEKMALELWESA